MRSPVAAAHAVQFALATCLALAGMGASLAPAAPALAQAGGPSRTARPAVSRAAWRFLTPPRALSPVAGVRQACPAPARPGQMQCQALAPEHPKLVGAHGLVQLGALTPAQLQAAYNLTAASASQGAGQTVAVVDAYDDPNAASDLVQYRHDTGLPACANSGGTGAGPGCLTVVDQTGGTNLPIPDYSGGWGLEESLDVDMVSAICPNCHILLVEADSDSLLDLAVAEDYAAAHAHFVSDSWGSGSEFIGENYFDSAFNHLGVAITAPAGDSQYGLQYPAASPYVTAVGGTTLNMQGTTFSSELVWGGYSDGTGSGCSVLEPKPPWQVDASSPGGCLNRTQNDVAAVADPNTAVAVYDTFADNTLGWQAASGTSVATAIIAGVYALAGTPAAGTYPASYPYQHPSDFRDITFGYNSGNGSCPTSRGYLCGAFHPYGTTTYDGPTGWGVPDGPSGFQAPASGNVITLEDPGTQDVKLGAAVAVPVPAHSSGSQTLTYSADGLPSGLGIAPATGLISGVPAAAGTSAVTVTATDSTGASGSVTFRIVSVPSLRTALHRVHGPVRFGVPGKCLDDRHDKRWNGNRIQIWTCNGRARQRWVYVPDGNPGGAGTLRIHSKCLDVKGRANSSKGVLWTCDGRRGEQWFLAGYGQLVNPASGRCLTGPTSGANGAQVRIYDCTGRTNQTWRLPASPVLSGVGGKCLDDPGNLAVDGNPVQIATCDGSTAQKWAAKPDGTLRIHGYCLDVSGGSILDGAPLVLHACGLGASSQQWVVGPSGELINAYSGWCLADPGDSANDGTQLVQSDCYGAAGQIWALS